MTQSVIGRKIKRGREEELPNALPTNLTRALLGNLNLIFCLCDVTVTYPVSQHVIFPIGQESRVH